MIGGEAGPGRRGAEGAEPAPPDEVERCSRAASLTVLEIDADPRGLIPALLLADLMSPALWSWRERKRALGADGRPLSARSRLDQLQRFFHHYTFTILPGEPGGDAWGLTDFSEEALRLGAGFVAERRAEYDATLRRVRQENPASQFGRIVDEPYYARGLFPRLRSETIEVMDAMARVHPEGKASGKCIGLGVLWAAALAVWGRFPLDRVVIVGNRAHLFVYLDVEDGHLLNNTRWFSTTRIRNRSALSEMARSVASGTETTFFYVPRLGMCRCAEGTSEIPAPRLGDIHRRIADLLGLPLRHPPATRLRFIEPDEPLPDPAGHESAESYRMEVERRARERPRSVCALALYAWRSLRVRHPEAYVRAALRDWHTRQEAAQIRSLDEALGLVRAIDDRRSIFGSRERIALPDETRLFRAGHDRDRALRLYALLRHSRLADPGSVVAFTPSASLVRYRGAWIDADSLNPATPPREGILVDDRATTPLGPSSALGPASRA